MKNRQRARDAAKAHTDLTMFDVVASIVEGGHLYTQSADRAAARIIKICKDEQQRQLRAMDAALAKITEADDAE